MVPRVLNLDSAFNLTPSMNEMLLNRVRHAPIYNPDITIILVSQETMDRLFPPSENKRLELALVQQMLEEHFPETRNLIAEISQDFYATMKSALLFWRKISRTYITAYIASYRRELGEKYGQMCHSMAIRLPCTDWIGNPNELLSGLDPSGSMSYMILESTLHCIHDPETRERIRVLLALHQNSLPKARCIFLCMDRIVASVDSMSVKRRTTGIDRMTAIASVAIWWVIHLMTKAYVDLDPNRYLEGWCETINDGLVTAYALSLWRQCPDGSLPIIEEVIGQLPLEYKVYRLFTDYPHHDLERMLNAWKNDDAKTFIKFMPPAELLAACGADSSDPIYPEFMHRAQRVYHPPNGYWAWLGIELLKRIVLA